MDMMKNGVLSAAESILSASKNLEYELEKLGHRIKEHEGNLLYLKSKKNGLEESILDLQVTLGRYHHSSTGKPEIQDSSLTSEDPTSQIFSLHENSAAGLICMLKNSYGYANSDLPLIRNVLGAVALLGTVEDSNISRILSEYLGVKTMLAVVCKGHEDMKALEAYDKEGFINRSGGLHGVGSSVGKTLKDRFLIICLESLRPYSGEFLEGDPQRRLDLIKPRMPDGECPPGFLGFAVNMITLEPENLVYVTANGSGLRETLFYNLFFHLQVYRTRSDMMRSLPLISDGAVSLDGGMIRTNGVFACGTREDVDVRFGGISKCPLFPEKYHEKEKELKTVRWRREKLMEDVAREQSLLEGAKSRFEVKKQEFLKFLSLSASYATQVVGGALPSPR